MRVLAVAVPAAIPSETHRAMLSAVAPEKQARISRFHRPADAHRTLLADILARTALCRASGLTSSQLRFAQSQHGKPCLTMPMGLEYNVSHSGRWVVAAVHTAPVGIDIEEIRPIEDDVAQRFFSPAECAALSARVGVHRLAFFYDIWTAKESYLKFTGEGLSRPLESFSITFASDQITLLKEPDAPSACFQQFAIDPDYRLTVCADSPDCFPARPEVIAFEELVQEFNRYTPR